MIDENDSLCACDACPGSDCACGCQDAPSETTCACGPLCACGVACNCPNCRCGSKVSLPLECGPRASTESRRSLARLKKSFDGLFQQPLRNRWRAASAHLCRAGTLLRRIATLLQRIPARPECVDE